jgi:predicted RNase H-like HicB family nuclease
MGTSGEPLAYNVQIWQEDGVWMADCPALGACTTYGDSHDEAVANMRDAIRVALDDLRANGEAIPPNDAPPSTIAIAV